MLFPVAGMLFPTLAHKLVIVHPPCLGLNVLLCVHPHLIEFLATLESLSAISSKALSIGS